MYEFVDRNGERVSIRSARTLEQLLVTRRITGETRFRMEGETAFKTAAEHPAVLQLAEQHGIQLGGDGSLPREPAPRPAQAEAMPRPSSTGSNSAASPQPGGPELAPPPMLPQSQLAPSPRSSAANLAPWSRIAPARSAEEPSRAVPGLPGGASVAAPPDAAPARIGPARPPIGGAPDFLAEVCTIVFAYLAAVLAGAIVGLAAGTFTHLATIGWVAAVAGTAYAARLAARRLRTRVPSPTALQLGTGSIVFLAGCLLAGWAGLIVGLPACAVLHTVMHDHDAA